jgi:hypothetical protein
MKNQKIKKNFGESNAEKKLNYSSAFYMTLGAAAIGVVAFIFLKNKK